MGLAFDTAEEIIAARNASAAANPAQTGVAGRNLRGISNALWYIDTPAAAVRSVIDYGMDGQWNNPLDARQRVSADDIAERATGVTNPAGKFVLGTALGVATDPLTFVSGPLKALTAGGKAARAIGLLDDAASVASRQLQQRAVRGLVPTLPGRAQRTLKALGRDSIDDFVEHTARPLVGQRAAQRQTTLRQLVDQVKDPDQAARIQQHLDGFLRQKRWNYDDIADTPLSGSWGFADTVGDPFGANVGDASARFFDAIGENVRWSPVGRIAHSVSNKLAGGVIDPIAQATAIEINSAGGKGASLGARKSGDIAQLIQFAEVPDDVARRTGIRDANGADAIEAIDRYVEGVAATARDIDFVENTPKIKEFASVWPTLRAELLSQSKDAGINAHQLRHKFGAAYRPYMMTTALDRTILGKGGGRGAYYDLVTGDQIARKKFLQLPGGIDQLRHYAKKKEFLGGRLDPKTGKPTMSDNDVANWLMSDIHDPNGEYYRTVPGSEAAQYPGRVAAAKAAGLTKAQRNTVGVLDPSLVTPRVTRGQTKALARFLNQLDPADPVVFGNHPAEAVARYTTGRMKAVATGEALGDAVVSRAIAGNAGDVLGGKVVPLHEALGRVGLKSQRTAGSQLPGGAAARAREAIAAKLAQKGNAVSPDDVDLRQYFVPESFLDNLTRTQNLLASPKEKGMIGEFLSQMTRAFKSQVLAWPSRVTRDWLSGAIGNVVTVGDPIALSTSMYHSQTLLNGNHSAALDYIRSLPAYSTVGNDEKMLSQYLSDLAEAGVLKGMGSVEREIGDRSGKALLEVLPGSTPLNVPIPNAKTVTDIATDKNSLDFYGIKGVSIGNRPRTWGQYAASWASDPLGITSTAPDAIVRRTTNNPIFKKFEDAAEWSDAHTRLSGYNALLAQGVSPKEAARRLKEIHVDYESLTDIEKRVRDLAIPFLSYTVRSGQYAAKEALLNPGGPYSQTLRAFDRLQGDDQDSYLPQSYRDRGGFGIDPKALSDMGVPDYFNIGLAPSGMQAVLGGIDIPGTSALNMVAYRPSAMEGAAGVSDMLSASGMATVQSAASQMSPILRTVAEAAFGVDMHTKQPIGRVPSQWDKVAMGVTGDKHARISPLARHALDLAIPGASRVTGFVGTALDPRVESRSESAVNALFNTVSPVRRYFVDEDQKRRDELAAIDQIIGRTPGARSFSRTTLPDEVVATLPPEFQALVARKKVIEKQMRDESKAAKSPSTPEGRAKRFKSTRTKRQPRQAAG